MPTTEPATTAPPPWRNSPAKRLLRELLMDEESWIHLCLLEQIHLSEPLFYQYKWTNFRNNFNSLSKQIDLEKASIAADRVAYERYMQDHPRPPVTNRGNLFWDGHPAQQLLRQDVNKQAEDLENGVIARCKLPLELHDTRPEYKQFPIATFRNHYYREKRALIETVYWQKKRNRDGQKKREAEEQKDNDELD